MSAPPLTVDLPEVVLQMANGVPVQGAGRLELVTPWGPQLSFAGLADHSPAELFRGSIEDAEARVPGVLFAIPVRETVVTHDGLEWTLRYRSTPSTYHLGSASVRVTGIYHLDEVHVRPLDLDGVTGKETVVEVHSLGRPCGFIGRDRYESESGITLEGLRVQHGPHELWLRHTLKSRKDAVSWEQVGTFAYRGPLDPQGAGFEDFLWASQIVIGSALGVPLSPFAMIGRGAGNRWEWARFRRPRRLGGGRILARPVGLLKPEDDPAPDLRSWIEAALAAWHDLDPKLGLEIALLYNENGPSQPEPEMRCRAPMIAFERLLAGYRQVHGLGPQSKLSSSLAQVSKLLPWRPFTDGANGEINKIHMYRLPFLRSPTRLLDFARSGSRQ